MLVGCRVQLIVPNGYEYVALFVSIMRASYMKTRTEPNPKTLFILRTSLTTDSMQHNISVMKPSIVTDLKRIV